MVNAEATPVPDKVTVCGLDIASSVSVSVPVCDPEAEGVKITLILQEAAGDSVLPQLLVSENWEDAAMLARLMRRDRRETTPGNPGPWQDQTDLRTWKRSTPSMAGGRTCPRSRLERSRWRGGWRVVV